MFLSSCSCNCADFFLVQWVAKVLGYVMNALYEFLDIIGIANIGICIILFTVIVKLLLLPMTIKQHKFTRLSSVMNPELQAIQKKYRNKTDQESMVKMREETNAVYDKYGTSASSGCGQMLIQMPILLALYAVISSMPAYVSDVEDMYYAVSEVAYESIDEYKELDKINKLIVDADELEKEDKTKFQNYSKLVEQYYTDKDKEEAIKVVYEQFSNLTVDSWNQYDQMYEYSETIVENIKKVEDWDKLIEENSKSAKLLEKYSKMSDEDLESLLNDLKANNENLYKESEQINDVYQFLGINLSKSPSSEMGNGIWWALLIPILSAVSQFASMKISQSRNKTDSSMEDNPMMQSMNTTMMFMPLMSAFLCYTLPAGMGIYWVISSVVQMVQQIFINMYFDKLDVNDIIKKNIEKVNKKRVAQGLPPRKITEVANVNVKNIKYENKPASTQKTTSTQSSSSSSNTSASTSDKKMSIAAKANMVKSYNEKNKK